MKVVINRCFGGFGLSAAAEDEYAKLAGFDLFRYSQTKYNHSDGEELYEKVSDGSRHGFLTYTFKEDQGDSFSKFPEDGGYWYSSDIERTDPYLVEVVEKLGDKANGDHASLKVVEIPDGVEYEISEYDGNEHIAEAHQTWG